MNTKLKGPEDFKANSGWLHKFKSRHEIRELQIQGESLSADSSSAENFKQIFQLFVEKEGYSQDSVYNADESGLNWKALPRKSLASCQEHAARGFKVSKERVTIMTCANAAGTHKLPLLLIGKSKKPRCFKNIKNHHKTGKVLLLLENAPTHPSAEVLNLIDPDYKVMFFPPNVTSLIQPMDQRVIEKFKRMYRKQMLRRLLLNEGTEESVVAFSKLLNLKHCCYMAADAWDNLTEENLRNAWKKLWVASMELEAEEEITDLNNLDDFVDLFNKIPGFNDCNYDDAVDWLATDVNDLGYQILDSDEIISSLQNEESDDSSSDESMSTPKGPTSAAFETGLEWFEKQAECCPAQFRVKVLDN
ncbi:jerky protein homolog-like [Acyrthosiphon pisum]|uniref:HTH CENPB-type domain-containing protein n=1 Tax=Acyrthosiphon pisum TaxID=7029 RepID=A0A8R2F8S5_ACYPI|nr:jerky protein homolog-like [Acyrthosiphon pisum]|eukprot:XP_008183146.1 PREDICTED: jerky protein homolog-like [Acyrthosiphon pisum]